MPQAGIYSAYQLGLHDHSSLTQGGPIVTEARIAGNVVVIANADPKTTTAGAFVKVKEITIEENSKGQCDVYYTLTASAGTAHARAYYNGVAFGADNSVAPGPTTFHDTLVQDLVVGSKIQIYAYGVGGITAIVEQMELHYSNALLNISRHTLNTTLPTSYAIPILTYNTDP